MDLDLTRWRGGLAVQRAAQTPLLVAWTRRAITCGTRLLAAAGLVLGLVCSASAATMAMPTAKHASQPPLPANREEAQAMLARLSDEDVRKLLLEQLDRSFAEQKAAAGPAKPWVLTGEGAAIARLQTLLSGPDRLREDWSRIVQSIARGSDHPWLGLLAGLALCLVAGAALERVLLRPGGMLSDLAAPAGPSSEEGVTARDVLRKAAAHSIAGVLFLAGGVVVLHLLPWFTPGGRVVASAAIWLIGGSRVLHSAIRAVLLPGQQASPWPITPALARTLSRHLCVVSTLVLLKVIDRDVLEALGAQQRLVLTVVLVTSSVLVGAIIVAILAVRRASGGDTGSHGGTGLVAVLRERWHYLATGYVLAVYAFAIYGHLVTGKPALLRAVLSLALVFAIPIWDFLLRGLATRLTARTERDDPDFWESTAVEPSEPSELSEPESHGPLVEIRESTPPTYLRDALVTNFRLLLALGVVVVLARLWGFGILALVEALLGDKLAGALFVIAVAGVFAFIIWEIVKASVAAHAEPEPAGGLGIVDEGGAMGLTRAQTIMPLIGRTVGAALVVMLVMISLSAFGVDIGPLLAGAGVVGLAIGFGAQTLVRDIVSGVFFLLDDAFRMGEYLSIGNTRGTVEKISVRSLRLRHHRGPLHTLPYGEIHQITNYSRDYSIMKFEVRVPFETDVEKVRKLIKQVGVELSENEELAAVMLEPLKSQGVNRMDDSSFVVRCKFTTLPGKQFTVRRHAYAKIQEAFRAEGIKFAPRRVVVETVGPSDSRDTAALAGAAVAATQMEGSEEAGDER